MIRNILFDAYGTLISTGNGSVKATAEILKAKGSSLDATAVYAEWKKLHRNHMSELTEYMLEEKVFLKDLEALYKLYGLNGNVREDIQPMLASLYQREPFEDTIPALTELQKEYSLAIASNTDTAPLLDVLHRNKLPVTAVFTSEMLMAYKPQAIFYEKTLNALGWKAEETVYVGDSPLEDVIGPKGIGMKTVLLDRKERYGETAEADAVIKTLLELKDCLKEMRM